MTLIFSSEEKKDIIKAWVIISIAFSILITKNLFSADLFLNFLISFFTVGVGFLFHELAHKYLAQKYRYFAEFKADNKMLLISIASAFLGFLFAAPGGVQIGGGYDQKKFGKIAAAGPAMNIILAVIFLILDNFSTGIFKTVTSYGYNINSWLALFNLIPIFPFDGGKILNGSKTIYFTLVIISILLMVLGFLA